MATYVKIATVDVGSGGAASIGFTSIPATYTDLVIKVSSRQTTGDVYAMLMTYNSNSGTPNAGLQGYGSGSGNGYQAVARVVGNVEGPTYTASTFGNTEIYIHNYADSGVATPALSTDATENNGTAAYLFWTASQWSSNGTVSSITLTDSVGHNFVQYSTATLYGISAT